MAKKLKHKWLLIIHLLLLCQHDSSSIRSGYISIDIGRLGYSGTGGYGWSSRANSSDLRYVYILSFFASGVKFILGKMKLLILKLLL